MRLIGNFINHKEALKFSSYLLWKGIKNTLEAQKDSEKSLENYLIWVHEETEVQAALQWLKDFQSNPEDPRFEVPAPLLKVESVPAPPSPELSKTELLLQTSQPKVNSSRYNLAKITFLIIAVCITLYLIDVFQIKTTLVRALPMCPATSLRENCMYDNPRFCELEKKLSKRYTLEELSSGDLSPKIPLDDQKIISQWKQTKRWPGLYEILVIKLIYKLPLKPLLENTVLFEKIRQGEVWRLFTPALLHEGILHILFNMLWLMILGVQLETRLGTFKYLSLIFLAGVFSNTSQYLVSGSNFLGFSGIICAMLAFIWVRQNRYPWEGYYLERSTFLTVGIFILLMFGLQFIAFAFSIFKHDIPILYSIGNTAHLSGALIGALLAVTPFFKTKARY